MCAATPGRGEEEKEEAEKSSYIIHSHFSTFAAAPFLICSPLLRHPKRTTRRLVLLGASVSCHCEATSPRLEDARPPYFPFVVKQKPVAPVCGTRYRPVGGRQRLAGDCKPERGVGTAYLARRMVLHVDMA
ncbi:hypothetical protein E2C01_033268 [Portunus trituberculatus]|uniref:Uncharacterized protein n=1 Tax=Portunus trituberculatus TaxID=210409 RepID=A0A5B7EY95_PORTR|nr:hypothetical protein [Portunus trituberculatus]